jgi:hypothetical protein
VMYQGARSEETWGGKKLDLTKSLASPRRCSTLMRRQVRPRHHGNI